MPLTNTTLTEKVRRLLQDQGKKLSDTIDADIEAAIPEALGALSVQVANNPDPRYRGYGQAEFSVAIVSGETAALSDLILVDTVLRVTHPTLGSLSHAKDFTYLKLEKTPMGGGWYAIEQTKLYAFLDDGETPVDDDMLVLLANQTLTLANLHAQLEDDLVAMLFGLINGGGQSEPVAA